MKLFLHPPLFEGRIEEGCRKSFSLINTTPLIPLLKKEGKIKK